MEVLLIRCTAVGPREAALAEKLAPAFGTRVRFVIDSCAASHRPTADERAIPITRGWLARRGLADFPGCGWRCGDYALYAAAEALPRMETAWLIEADVWPALDDPAGFFASLAERPEALLAPRFSQRGPEWFWHWLAVQAMGEGPVFGCLFPMVRLDRAAIQHLAEARLASLTRAAVAGPRIEDAAGYPVPNDEAFVATTLARDGFACGDLSALRPAAFRPETFGWEAPLMPAEATMPELAGQVLHPVLEPPAARAKLAMLRDRWPERLAARRAQAIARLGPAAWAAWSGEDTGGDMGDGTGADVGGGA